MRAVKERLVQSFEERFGKEARPRYFVGAPGRVNLLGEHTDYNDGFVLPMAIQQEVNIVAAPRDDGRVRIYSLNFEQDAELHIDRLSESTGPRWSEYLRGVLVVLQDAGFAPRGMDLVLYGDVPAGAGLSSSAALEIATLLASSAVSGFEVEPTLAARLAQKAENEVVGVNCGIMDQFASRLGRKDAALLLDCRSLDYELVPLKDPAVRIVIVNSNVRRGLVDSAYNERRRECEEGARLLGVPALRDLTSREFAQQRDRLPDNVRKRSQHVIEENERVLSAVEMLKKGDLVGFGEAMWASHASLRDLFEVSCPELDALVEIAREVDGVLGSRMTGAGFGGCTVSLVREEAIERLERAVRTEYPKRTGLEPDIWVLTPEDAGAFVEPLS